MRIYTRAGDLAFKTFHFPDGQPHFILETFGHEFDSATIETAIKCPSDLFQVLLVADVLRQNGYQHLNLDIRYLMAARMDRAIDPTQPFTLNLVARLINGVGFGKVRILDAHSEVATMLIRNSTNVLPVGVVKQVLLSIGGLLYVAIPDKGAYDRVNKTVFGIPYFQCSKVRDPQTGALSGFKVGVKLDHVTSVLIVDDICDGGGTFVGLAKELRKAGASKVSLFCTHGIFSKGLPLEGIDKIFTTDSYLGATMEVRNSNHIPFKNCGTVMLDSAATIIPISMKELP